MSMTLAMMTRSQSSSVSFMQEIDILNADSSLTHF